MGCRYAFLIGAVLLVLFGAAGCDEIDEALDENNDIIVTNYSETDLWIRVNGVRYGRLENNGNARTIVDGIADGVHVLEAYLEDDYELLHCTVITDYLNGGEDFYWFLQDDAEYTGTKEGDC